MQSRIIELAKENNFQALKNLIEQDNSNINESDDFGQTALLWAASRGHKEIVEYLIQKGASLTVTTRVNVSNSKYRGMNPLQWAIYNGHTEVALILILQWAIYNGHIEVANALINQNFSNEKGRKKQKEILSFIKNGKQAINFLIQYPDKATLFINDDRIKNFIYSQVSKEPNLLIDLIEKLPTTILVKHENYLLDLIVKTKFGVFDKLLSWFSPKYKENKIQSYSNQFIEQLKERNTPESNSVLGNIFLLGLFSQEKDEQEATDFFQRVNQDSSPELYIDAQYELASIYSSSSYTEISKNCFKNIIKVGERYLDQQPNNVNVKDQVEHAKFMSSVLSKNPEELMFFGEHGEEKLFDENDEELKIENKGLN